MDEPLGAGVAIASSCAVSGCQEWGSARQPIPPSSLALTKAECEEGFGSSADGQKEDSHL